MNGVSRALVASVTIAAQLVTTVPALAMGPLSPAAGVSVKRGAPHLDEREGTIDYPVVYTNTTAKAIEGPIQIVAPPGLKNFTVANGTAKYVTLPTQLAPGQSFEQIFRFDAPKTLGSPDFSPMVENIGQVIAKFAPSPGILRPALAEYRASSDYPYRIRATAGEEYVWDADATNPNGGTLRFTLVPMPAGTSRDLAKAPYATGVTVEPTTGIVRWTPPAAGLYTARLNVVDGKALNGSFYDLAFKVEPPSTAAPLTCVDYVASTYEGYPTPIRYLQSRDGVNASPAVTITTGRTAGCTLNSGTRLLEGKYPVSCETSDGFWPKGSCKFNVVVNRISGSPPPTGDGTGDNPITISVANSPNLMVETGLCGTEKNAADEKLCPTGYGTFSVRNTGFAAARNVLVSIPIPAEADRDTAAIRSSVQAKFNPPNSATAPIVIQIGELPRGGVATFAVAFAPKSYVPMFHAVTISVTTQDPEITTHDNSAMFYLGSPIQPSYNQDPKVFVHVPCDEACQKSKCRGYIPKNKDNTSTFAAMVFKNDPCEKPPKWFAYVISGVMAVGLVCGVGGFLAVTELGMSTSYLFQVPEVITLAR